MKILQQLLLQIKSAVFLLLNADLFADTETGKIKLKSHPDSALWNAVAISLDDFI